MQFVIEVSADAAWPARPWRVPIRALWHFAPMPVEEWRRMDNNAKAKLGKNRFLEQPGALDATAETVRDWLRSRGLEAGKRWVEIVVAPDLAPRYVNVTYAMRCVDAFMRQRDGLQGVELKVSGSDGVCGLTVSEERLLRAAHIRVLAVNPVRGLIGEFDSDALLRVPRRVDGIPVGRVLAEWEW
jgi:hypothetical protein